MLTTASNDCHQNKHHKYKTSDNLTLDVSLCFNFTFVYGYMLHFFALVRVYALGSGWKNNIFGLKYLVLLEI